MIFRNLTGDSISAGTCGFTVPPHSDLDASYLTFTPEMIRQISTAVAGGYLQAVDGEARSLIGQTDATNSELSLNSISSGGASMQYTLFNGVTAAVLATADATSDTISLVRRYPTVQVTVEGTGAVTARAVLYVRSDPSGSRWIPRMTIDISDTDLATDGDTLNEFWTEAKLVIENITGTNAKVYAVLEN